MVNGIVDYGAVQLCFLPHPAGASGSELPWPATPTGLPFARGATVDIAAQIPTASDVEVVAVAGWLEQGAGLSCQALVANAPPGVFTRSLGVLPQTVFAEQKSLLIATTGCMGGVLNTHESETSVCGQGYTPTQATATMVAGFMSRIADPNAVSLQFVHAVRAMDQVVLRVVPAQTSSSSQLVSNNWTWGAVAPFPPFSDLGAVALGDVDKAEIEIYIPNASTPQNTTTFATALNNSSLTASDVANGRTLVLVAVGPSPGMAQGPWWKPLTYVLVDADPP